MIFVTRTIPVSKLVDRDVRQRVLEVELEQMAKERGRAKRRALEGQRGAILPPEGAFLGGDVVLVMVDEGEGQDVSSDIVGLLGNGA